MSTNLQTNYTVNMSQPAVASLLNTISELDSGKTIIVLAQAAIQTYTLPAAKLGLRYRFLVGSALVAFNVTIASAVAGAIYGTLLNLTPGAAAACVITATQKGPSNSLVITAAARLGDYVDMNCDGTFWYVSRLSTVAVGLT